MRREIFVLVVVIVLAGGAYAGGWYEYYTEGQQGEILGVGIDGFSSQFSHAVATNIVDHSGLGIFGGLSHHIDPGSMWLANTGNPAAEWISFDLGGVYNLTSSNIWNYNERWPVAGMIADGNLGHTRGVGTMDILVAGADKVYTLYAANVALNEAGDGAPVFDTIPIIANGVQYVMFDIKTNLQPRDGYVGLSEVDFFGQVVPEPATMVLLGLGGIALIRRRRAV